MSLDLPKITPKEWCPGRAKKGGSRGQDPPIDLPARVKGFDVKGLVQDDHEWFQIRLVRFDGSSEAVYEGDSREALAWTRQWLKDHLGLTVAIVPIGQSRQEAA